MRFLEESIEEYDRVIQTVWEVTSGGKRKIVAALGVVVLLGEDFSTSCMISIQRLGDGRFSWSTGDKSGTCDTFWTAQENLKAALNADYGEKAEGLDLGLEKLEEDVNTSETSEAPLIFRRWEEIEREFGEEAGNADSRLAGKEIAKTKLTDLPTDVKRLILINATAFTMASKLVAMASDQTEEGLDSYFAEKATEFINSMSPEQLEEAIKQIDDSDMTIALWGD